MTSAVKALIFGLGNYSMAKTRHSIGMMIVDELAKKLDLSWKKDGGSLARIALGDGVILAKPTNFMNLNGKAVARLMNKHELSLSQLLVIHDDLDKKVGEFSFKEQGSPGGHNGVKSVINHLMNHEFQRCRIGIGRPAVREDVPDYVLEPFRPAEQRILREQVFDNVTDEIIKRMIFKPTSETAS